MVAAACGSEHRVPLYYYSSIGMNSSSLLCILSFKFSKMNRLLCLFLLLFTANVVQGQTSYVSDRLETPLRAGASLHYKILRMVPSGTAVTVVQTDAENSYTLVRTPDNIQGWIASQDLMDTPSARDKLTNTQKELERVTSENVLLKNQLHAIMAHGGDAEASFGQVMAENERLRLELTEIRKIQSGDIDLNEKNRDLQERVVKLERELQLTQQENQVLVDDKANRMFLIGAGVLLSGIVLGLLLPGLRLKKRETWGEL
jgi:SH3 domain protein